MGDSGKLVLGIHGTALALDSVSGTEVWRAELKGADFVNVVELGSMLCATTKGEIFALDPGTGKVLWNNKLKGLGTGLLTIAASAEVSPLYLGIRGTVLALDASTGTELWRTKLKGSDFVNLVLQDGRLVATAKGEIFALDPTTGKVLWN